MSGMGKSTVFTIEQFRNLNGPLIDIRSPKEFNQGHWPGAINLPLFTNNERAAVGIAYKKNGRLQAIRLGLQLVNPKLKGLKEALIGLSKESLAKSKKINKNHLKIYCWRGGMRSASVGWLANILELNPIILSGGYKSYRRWALQQLEKDWPLRIIGGQTGTGKTDILIALSKRNIPVIDLEGLANHRGSSFGALGLPEQPSTEYYENLIAEKLESFKHNCSRGIWLEGESSNLGCCRIPHNFYNQMKTAPVIEITRSINERINQLVKVYANHKQEDLEQATLRISRRLGPQRTTKALEAIKEKRWSEACIEMLDYYDRCYEYELKKVSKRNIIDVTGISPVTAAERLLQQGLIC